MVSTLPSPLCGVAWLVILSLLVGHATGLRLVIQPTTTVNASTNVYWIREPSDRFDVFDIRFMRNNVDSGLAKAAIDVTSAKGRVGVEKVEFPLVG